MVAEPQVYVFVLALAVAWFWSIPLEWPRVRGGLLVAFSTLLLYLASPPALAVALAMTFVAWATCALQHRRPRLYLPWVGSLLIVAGMAATYIWNDAVEGFALKFGIAYVGLKSISAILDDYELVMAEEGDPGPGPLQLLLLNLFFPIYAAGPIERSEAFALDHLQGRWSLQSCLDGLSRVLIGLFQMSFLGDSLVLPLLDSRFEGIETAAGEYGVLARLAFCWGCLLYLYFNFAGATNIAIGAGRLFNIELRENFDYPFLARNITEFWRRWHISLADWVYDYLFFPLARATGGRTKLSVFLSFALIGLWHAFEWKWLAWGAMHGVGLALVMIYGDFVKKRPGLKELQSKRVYTLAAWALTMTYVSYSSVFARVDTVGEALHVLGIHT